jgi:hypothetical protein
MLTDLAEFHEEAAVEYDAAFDWYLNRSPEAAFRFDAEVDRALAQIIEAPQRWAAGWYSTRRFLLRQFPFTLICIPADASFGGPIGGRDFRAEISSPKVVASGAKARMSRMCFRRG